MGQRLGLATAIPAEPQVLLLDEPANGLDPQSIHWLRDYFLKYYASQGRTVFVSSHLLQRDGDHGRPRRRDRQGASAGRRSISDFVNRSTTNDVLVRSPHIQALVAALAGEIPGVQPRPEPPDGLSVSGLTTDQIGDIAFRHGVPLYELTKRTASLEQAFSR